MARTPGELPPPPTSPAPTRIRLRDVATQSRVPPRLPPPYTPRRARSSQHAPIHSAERQLLERAAFSGSLVRSIRSWAAAR